MEFASVVARTVGRAQRTPTGVPLYGAENNMDPGPVLELPAVSEIEEMLIARVHVAMQVRQVRGQQYKYSGHVINFLRNTGRVYNSLPLLPEDLDIVILRPSNANSEQGLRHQFRQECRVRKLVVRDWLEYLRQHHPGYAGITLNELNLQQLPDDMDVLDEMHSRRIHRSQDRF